MSQEIQYFEGNNLVSASETNFIVFPTKEKLTGLGIKANNQNREKINVVKITNRLGIVNDSNHIWEKNIICNKISSNLSVNKRLSSMADLDVLHTAYYRLVYLYITYGFAVQGQL